LHAAVIFKAPEALIQTLLVLYPRAAKLKDDQGMLPIHLSLRNLSTVPIVQLLLMSFIGCLEVKDRKGRVPMILAKNCKTSLQQEYIETIERAKGVFDVAKSAVQSNDMLALHQQIHNGNFDSNNQQTIQLLAKIDSLESNLQKSNEKSNELLKQVHSLETQLSSQNEKENTTDSNFHQLESTLRDVKQETELVETQLMNERSEWMRKIETLQKENQNLKEHRSQESHLEVLSPSTTKKPLSPKASSEDRLKNLEKENKKLKKELEEMDDIVRKKIHSEHTLASQVSDLASRLAESTSRTCTSTSGLERRIDALLKEKAELRQTIDDVTLKFKSALKTLEAMAKEHDSILKLSSKQEEMLAKSQKQQKKLLSNVAKNEQMMTDATWEREEIIRILTRQIKQDKQTKEERKEIMEAVKTQNQNITAVKTEREILSKTIGKQKSNMTKLKKDLNDIRMITADYEEDDLSEGGSDEDQDLTGDNSKTEINAGTFDSSVGAGSGDNNEDTDTGKELGQHECYENLLPNTSTLTDENDYLNQSDQDIINIQTHVDSLCNEAEMMVEIMAETNDSKRHSVTYI
jgi:chromosome segregation ATPase